MYTKRSNGTSSESKLLFYFFLEDKSFRKKVEDVVCITFGFSTSKIIVFPNQTSKPPALRLFSLLVDVEWGKCAPYIGKDQLDLVLSACGLLVENFWVEKIFIRQLIQQSQPIGTG